MADATLGAPGMDRSHWPGSVYDFATDDGQVKCDHATRPEAVRLRANAPIYRAWLELIGA